jgi:hypothetical protein
LRHRVNLIVMPAEGKPEPLIGKLRGPRLVILDQNTAFGEHVQMWFQPFFFAYPSGRPKLAVVVMFLKHLGEARTRTRIFNKNSFRTILRNQAQCSVSHLHRVEPGA